MTTTGRATSVLVLLLLTSCGVGDDRASGTDQEKVAPRPTYYKVTAPDDAPTRGPAVAPVTIVTFSDFQSSRGARNAAALAEIVRRFDGDVRVVYRANPQPKNLDSRRAELASRAAGRQGLFWEFHDRLFESSDLAGSSMEEIAADVGCDLVRFTADMESPDLSAPVARDRQEALELGITSMPFNFVNGVPLEAIRFVDDAASMVRGEIVRARKLAPSIAEGKSPYDAIVADGETRLPQPPGGARKVRDPSARYRIPVSAHDHFLGPADAPVTVVAFLDLQSPFFPGSIDALEGLSGKLKDRVRVVVRHFPQPSHPEARLAAEAALEAARQDKQWPFLEAVASAKGALSRDVLVATGESAGLDVEVLMSALSSGVHRSEVEAQRSLADSLDLMGTPQFFINGLLFSGSRSADQLLVLVENEARVAGEVKVPDGGVVGIYDHFTRDGATEAIYLDPDARKPDASVISEGGYKVYDVSVPLDSPREGSTDAPAVLVEFGDYQCGSCARLLPLLDSLREKYGDRLSLVYRHFPLSGHEHARLAAEAAVEAQVQGRFWEYHRVLMDNQGALTLDDLVSHAREAGLDAEEMRAALDDRRHRSRVSRDIEDARRLRLSGTPSFFVNGRKVTGSVEKELTALIDRFATPRVR